MSASEIVETLGEAITRFLPGRKTILTVSPVRHLGDGATENTLSKSTLILAAHALTESLPDCRYFPAYEILMDDLRDYRFYERDMVHPSETAVEYFGGIPPKRPRRAGQRLLDRAEALAPGHGASSVPTRRRGPSPIPKPAGRGSPGAAATVS